jgi:hypothetical protein
LSLQSRLSSVTPRVVHPSLRMRRVGVAILLGATLAPVPGHADPGGPQTASVDLHQPPAAAWLDRHLDQPAALRVFLQRFPKGGDIHTHLSGAVYAERYLDWAMADGYCVDAKTAAWSVNSNEARSTN